MPRGGHFAARAGIVDRRRPADPWLATTVRWTWKTRLLPQLESEIEHRLRDEAEAEAIRVFGRNLHDLLLAALAGQPGAVLRRRELVRAAWPEGAIVHDNTLDQYVARLRRKLRETAAQATIETSHGVGYRLL